MLAEEMMREIITALGGFRRLRGQKNKGYPHHCHENPPTVKSLTTTGGADLGLGGTLFFST